MIRVRDSGVRYIDRACSKPQSPTPTEEIGESEMLFGQSDGNFLRLKPRLIGSKICTISAPPRAASRRPGGVMAMAMVVGGGGGGSGGSGGSQQFTR